MDKQKVLTNVCPKTSILQAGPSRQKQPDQPENGPCLPFPLTLTTSLHLPILIEWTLIFPQSCAVSWFPSLESSCPHFSSHLGSPILSSVLLTELCLYVQIDSGLPCCPQDSLPPTLPGRIQGSAPVSVSPCLAPCAIA